MACNVPDIQFELMSILYNIGALHSKLGAAESRVSHEGMKIACTHFQCAAWAFQVYCNIIQKRIIIFFSFFH